MTTRDDARADGLALLRSRGDPTAVLDADLLLAHACGIGKEELYAHLDAPIDEREAGTYRELVARRAAGEPVAYLRGYKEFFGLRLAVDARVLIPRPETEVLVEAALAFMRREARFLIADVGTGSGAVAIAIAVAEPRARVVATESASGAIEVARANMQAHAVADRVELRKGDLLGPVEGMVEAVVANLPYLRADALEPLAAERTSLRFEPRDSVLAGGADGLDVIRRCVAQLPAKLAPGGAAFFECDPPQASEVAALLARALLGATRVIPDLAGAPRVVEGARPT